METKQKNKNEIRKAMLARRRAMDPRQVWELSSRCMEHLLKLQVLLQSEQLFFYMDVRGEVCTKALLLFCRKHGVKAAVPKVEGTGIMNFYEIQSQAEVQPGYRGIPEPVTEKQIYPDRGACMILPGTAFDRTGGRLGYGGGFYDSYCSRFPDMYRIALCYHWQVLEHIPREPHDKPMNMIITDKGVITCNR